MNDIAAATIASAAARQGLSLWPAVPSALVQLPMVMVQSLCAENHMLLAIMPLLLDEVIAARVIGFIFMTYLVLPPCPDFKFVYWYFCCFILLTRNNPGLALLLTMELGARLAAYLGDAGFSSLTVCAWQHGGSGASIIRVPYAGRTVITA